MNFGAPHRSGRVESVIDITSLVDVVFLLLIFLLVTTTFKEREHAFTLSLPTATEQELVIRTDRTTVFITQEGAYFFLQAPESEGAAGAPSEALTVAQLEERLRALQESAPDAEISVKAQENTPYQHFIDVMNLARKVGIQNVLLPYELASPEGAEAPAPAAPPAE